MKICYLANAASIHTQRWASHFARGGHEVTVASLTNSNIDGVNVRWIGPDPNDRGRVAYLAFDSPAACGSCARLSPDVVHAHYAGGYGLTAALQRVSVRSLSPPGAAMY